MPARHCLLCELPHQIAVITYGLASSGVLIIVAVWEAILNAERLTPSQVFLLTIAASILGATISMAFLRTQSKTLREWCLKLMGSSAFAVAFSPMLIHGLGWTPNAYVVMATGAGMAAFARIIIRALVPIAVTVVPEIFRAALKRFLGIEIKPSPPESDEDKSRE